MPSLSPFSGAIWRRCARVSIGITVRSSLGRIQILLSRLGAAFGFGRLVGDLASTFVAHLDFHQRLLLFSGFDIGEREFKGLKARHVDSTFVHLG